MFQKTVGDGITTYSSRENQQPNIKVIELMQIPKLKDTISGLMMLYRDDITIPYWRRRTVSTIGYVEGDIIAGSLPRSQVKDVKITTGNKQPFTGYAGVIYTSDVALLRILRAAEILGRGLEKRLGELRITPYLGVVTAKRQEADNVPEINFAMNIVDTGYVRIPSEEEIPGMDLVIADPMLATASTLIYTIEKVEERCKRGLPRKITITGVLGAQKGIERILENVENSKFRDIEIEIIIADVDRRGGTGLDNRGYIVPGGGDIGDLLCSSDVQHARERGMELDEYLKKYPLGVNPDLLHLLPLVRDI